MKGISCCGDCTYYSLRKHKCTRGCTDEGSTQDHFYKDCPLPDVVERKRGKWKKYGLSGFSYCSECKDCYISTDWLGSGKWSFCPNCGADMRGDNNG